jgi:hypothetical protein
VRNNKPVNHGINMDSIVHRSFGALLFAAGFGER